MGYVNEVILVVDDYDLAQSKGQSEVEDVSQPLKAFAAPRGSALPEP